MKETPTYYAGIDVAKDHLDVVLRPSGQYFEATNDERGIRSVVRRLRKENLALAVLEATGGLDPALRSLALPGYGGLAVAWGKRRPGAAQRVLGRSAIIFSRPWRAPREWLKEQYRLARLPGVLEAQLTTARSQVGLKGQREVLLDRLPELEATTLVVWGERDRVLPPSQAREAMARLRNGTFELVPDCGHLPQVERPERFASGLARFLDEKAR
jgi:pimeloyl-ACP methyl ester carboxylesterase